MRWILIVLLSLCLLVWSAAAFLLLGPGGTGNSGEPSEPLPTLLEFPTLTPSTTWTATWTQSPTPTVTLSSTATLTPTATVSPFPSVTPTLTTRVLDIAAIGDFRAAATSTALPAGTVLLPAPPPLVDPLPDATLQPPPYEGWYSFESDHPLVTYSSPWMPRQVREASRGQYHRTEDYTSTMSFPFEGEGLRIRYVAARNMGMFDLFVDGQKLDTIDAYHPELSFPGTQVYVLSRGPHLLQLRSAGTKNPASEGFTVGFDAVQVYRGSASTLIQTPAPVLLMPTSQPVVDIRLVSVPATTAPMEAIEHDVTVRLLIAYDENGNKAVDPAEGVREIPVRVVDGVTNRVLAESFTDLTGYTTITLRTTGSTRSVRVVVPYFSRVWDIPVGRGRNTGGNDTQLTLLLSPGNQPGLIP